MSLVRIPHVEIHPKSVNRALDKFERVVKHTINKVKRDHIIRKHQDDEKAPEKRERQEEQDVEHVLENPAMRSLKREVATLPKSVQRLQENIRNGSSRCPR